MTENPLLERAVRFVSALRHCQVLGVAVHEASEEGMTLVLPYGPHIVGDPLSGVIHGGALTSFQPTRSEDLAAARRRRRGPNARRG